MHGAYRVGRAGLSSEWYCLHHYYGPGGNRTRACDPTQCMMHGVGLREKTTLSQVNVWSVHRREESEFRLIAEEMIERWEKMGRLSIECGEEPLDRDTVIDDYDYKVTMGYRGVGSVLTVLWSFRLIAWRL